MTPFLALLLVVNGTVLNQSTGKPQPGATVTLYKLGQAGPESLESVKSGPDGQFRIDNPADGPHLVQAAHAGITYNLMLFPGRPREGLSIDVFDASAKPGPARVNTHMILLETDGSSLNVSESVVWENNGKASFYDPKSGTAKFYLPPAAGQVRVMCSHPARTGIPVERAADKSGAPNVYTVDFPVKPGETRFDLTYTLAGTSFDTKIIHGGGPVRIVVPEGIAVEGADVKLIDTHAETKASIYDVSGTSLSVKVTGTGSLRAPGSGGGASEAAPETEADEGAGLQQIRPRLYDRFYPILALTLIILALGFALLYRKSESA